MSCCSYGRGGIVSWFGGESAILPLSKFDMRTSPLLVTLPLIILANVAAESERMQVPEGRPLREIVADKFPDGNVFVGGTTGWEKYAREPGVILDREFSYITPENDYKHGTINPEPGVWNWELGDAWIGSSEKNGQLIRGHGPIGPQCSPWAREDYRTAEELTQSLEEFTTAFYQRYGNTPTIKWLDVINETVTDEGEWFGPKEGNDQWENPWTLLGFDEDAAKTPLYIKNAFEIATRYTGPSTELIINQHGSMEVDMWEKVKGLVPYLRSHDLRVDGIGWQAHIDAGWETIPGNLDRLHQLIAWCHENELSFHVTEMNAWIKDPELGNYDQAKTFVAVMRALLEHRENGVVSWNVWNLSDVDAWMQEEKWEGCLFDREYNAKPAYYELQKLLENPPAAK